MRWYWWVILAVAAWWLFIRRGGNGARDIGRRAAMFIRGNLPGSGDDVRRSRDTFNDGRQNSDDPNVGKCGC